MQSRRGREVREADYRHPACTSPGGHLMVMEKIEHVQEYTAMITQEILDRYDGVVRVWDTPRSAIDGRQVVDKIRPHKIGTLMQPPWHVPVRSSSQRPR